MPLTPDFSYSQLLGTPSNITLVDISTGSDGAISERRVTTLDKDGNDIVEDGTTTDYEVWAYADASILLDLFPEDIAVFMRTDWVNSGGTVLYTKTYLIPSVINLKNYYIFLLKCQNSNRSLINTGNFYLNFSAMLSALQSAITSTTLITDIGSAQAAIDRGNKLISNSANFF